MSSIRILLYPISWSFILSSLRSLKAPGIISCSSGIFDLSPTDSIIQECILSLPLNQDPFLHARSYLLSLKLKVTSITVWCRMLKDSPLYAILSVFSFCDTPGIGTFYDFFSRIWQDGRDNLSPNGRFPKMRLPKGKKNKAMSTHLCPIFIVHFSEFSFPAQYSVINFQSESHSVRFQEVIMLCIISSFPYFSVSLFN